MNQYYLATFDSTHYALKFEKIMKNNNIKLNVIPVPRELTANCGLAVMFFDELDKVKAAAVENQIVVKAYYEVKVENKKKNYNLV